MLKKHLHQHNFIVYQAESDADTLIVHHALKLASSGNKTIIVADDILVLLIHHYHESMADIYFFSEASKRRKEGPQIFNIRHIVDITDPVIRNNLLFAHAWSGCDCTSATFWQGKGMIIKLLLRYEEVRAISQTFYKPDATHVEIAQGGIRLFSLMYGGRDSNLNKIRYTSYMNVITKGLIKPEKLPPTESAAEYHSYRVYIHVIQWNSFLDTDTLPTDWGWKIGSGKFTPISTILVPAPQEPLNFIRCNCKPTSRDPCSTNICSCRKNTLKCVAACGNCHGNGCSNCVDISPDDHYVS